MATGNSPQGRRPVGCLARLLLLAFVGFWPLAFVPLMFAAVGPVNVPSTAQLAAPVVCPAGYQSSSDRRLIVGLRDVGEVLAVR